MSRLSVITEFCDGHDLGYEVTSNTVVVTVAGTARHQVTVAFSVGDKYLRAESFVCRQPDENHEAVYRWLLEQNARLLIVSFRIDRFGDVYLGGGVPVTWTTPEFLDSLLGVMVSTVDGSFNHILEAGFRSAIEREWAWRTSRGLDARNLEAFRHLLDPE